MAWKHTGNIQPRLDLEEHDGDNNAKRVNVVAGNVIGAVELKNADTDDRAYIGDFGGSYQGLAVHVVGDNDKRVISPTDEGGAMGNADAVPIAGEDASGNKQNFQADGDKNLMVAVQNSAVPSAYDYQDYTWTSGNLTSVVYKSGGAAGTTVATVAYTYDGNGDIDTITRT